MERLWFTFVLTAILATALTNDDIARGQENQASSSQGQHFAVTVTNLTRGQTFTPVLVASHKRGVRLFRLGHPASSEVAILAEEGDVGPLTNRLRASPAVFDVVNSGPPPGGFVPPGQSKTILVRDARLVRPHQRRRDAYPNQRRVLCAEWHRGTGGTSTPGPLLARVRRRQRAERRAVRIDSGSFLRRMRRTGRGSEGRQR
jgi:hypothetical protein